MYLERLELQGFKSFANKNKLIFPGLIDAKKRGLTAIVGPNGSGKSNVADAVRWALGEQSLKTIRGKKSEDVIFSGSDKKGQLGMAEVSLHLNNAEAAKNKQGAPEKIENESDLDQIILSAPEIIITRRIYRSGESEYLINGARVRLSDIQMLLAKANFGQKTYSVIGQGMVENFLNSSAAERKDFFDEATGVKQFQIKRDSALNKLENSYENLQQVEMLLAEIRPRLKSLTRQVEKLKKRDEISAELRKTQFNYYGYLWQDITRKLDSANQRFLELEKVKIEQERRLEKLNDSLGKIRATDNFREMSALQPRLRELENNRQQEQKRYSKLQAELEIQLEAQGQFDVSWLNNKLGELEGDLIRIEKELNQENGQELQSQESRLRSEIETVNISLDQAGAEERRLLSLENEKTALAKQLAKLEAVLEANLEAQGQFDVSWLNNKQEELQLEAANLQKEITALRLENNSDQEKNLTAKLAEIQTTLGRLSHELDELNRELKKKSQNGSQNEAIAAAVDEFLARLEEIGKENDLQSVKKQINAAKADFQKKIGALIKGGNQEDLSRVQELQTEIIRQTEEKQSTQEALSSERLRLFSARERLRLLEEKDLQVSREINDIRSKLEKAETKFDASQIEAEKEAINSRLGIIEKEYKELEAKLAALNAAQEHEKAQMFECQQSIQSLQQEISSTANEQSGLKIEAARQETRLEDLENNIRNDELELLEIKRHQVTAETINLEQWQKSIASHKSQLDQIGGIDPETEKEFEETKERYDFLSGQTEDLTQAVKSLENVIYELDLSIKERFDQEFKVISEKFDEYFKILFNGGSAKISKLMIEEEKENEGAAKADENSGLSEAEMKIKAENDEKLKRLRFLRKHNAVGLAGIDIQATPPGKKIQTVTMLSGGERALTAIALICAIISANPSPFVVLDEADAALDEANSERLARILDDLSNRTQFIVITHNRACMRRASVLYGVTMETDGVSKLLSVKLEDVKTASR